MTIIPRLSGRNEGGYRSFCRYPPYSALSNGLTSDFCILSILFVLIVLRCPYLLSSSILWNSSLLLCTRILIFFIQFFFPFRLWNCGTFKFLLVRTFLSVGLVIFSSPFFLSFILQLYVLFVNLSTTYSKNNYLQTILIYLSILGRTGTG